MIRAFLSEVCTIWTSAHIQHINTRLWMFPICAVLVLLSGTGLLLAQRPEQAAHALAALLVFSQSLALGTILGLYAFLHKEQEKHLDEQDEGY